MPDFIVFPEIMPYLPEDFVGLPSPHSKGDGAYRGRRADVEAFFNDQNHLMRSPIIHVDISVNVGQVEESFTFSKNLRENLASGGATNIEIKEWKWGSHPVCSIASKIKGKEIRTAWIGLNYASQVLRFFFVFPPPENLSMEESLKIWSDFLMKTVALDIHDKIKADGHDMREGYTLVRLWDSHLFVSAEKRKSDNKIQVVIKPLKGQISCERKDVLLGTMGLPWHKNDLILKIESVLSVKKPTSFTKFCNISILLKDVEEFSYNDPSLPNNELPFGENSVISILNLCENK